MVHSRDLCTCDDQGTCVICKVREHLTSMGLKEGSDEGDVYPSEPDPDGKLVCEYVDVTDKTHEEQDDVVLVEEESDES